MAPRKDAQSPAPGRTFTIGELSAVRYWRSLRANRDAFWQGASHVAIRTVGQEFPGELVMAKLHTLPIVALQVLEELRHHLDRAIERTSTPEDVKETLTDI